MNWDVDLVIGIDPGRHGGYAAITRSGSAEAHDLDLTQLLRWLVKLQAAFENHLVVYIEDVHAMPGQGVTSMFTFGFNTGWLHGMITSLVIPIIKVAPQVWKKIVLGKSYPHDKSGAIWFCNQHYPTVSLIPDSCRVAHDGIADSLCIAHYGWLEEFSE